MGNYTTEVVDTSAVLLNSTTLLASPSNPGKIEIKRKGFIGKVPVTIAQPKVQIYVEAEVRLATPALAITSVNKSVFLTRCLLLPTDDKKSSKLLLNGFVRKSIQLAVPTNDGSGSISGSIRFTSFDIPFKCFAKVDFLTEPSFNFNESLKVLQNADADYMGADLSEDTFVNSQQLNERVFCELIETKVREVDVKNDLSTFDGRTLFSSINESMVVELTLRVLQNQQVEVRDNDGGKDGKGDKDDKDGKGGRDDKDDKDDKCDKDDKKDKDDKDDKCDKKDKDDKCDKKDKDDKCDKKDKHDKDDKCDKDDKHDKDDKCDKDDKHDKDDKCDKKDKDDKCDKKDKDDKDDKHNKDDKHGKWWEDGASQKKAYSSNGESDQVKYRNWEKQNYGR